MTEQSDTGLWHDFKETYHGMDTWFQKLAFVACAPILYLFLKSAIAGKGYECPGCGTELYGTGHNCRECGYAFTEKGELSICKERERINNADR